MSVTFHEAKSSDMEHDFEKALAEDLLLNAAYSSIPRGLAIVVDISCKPCLGRGL